MKRLPLFILVLLLHNFGKAQNTTTDYETTVQPITTPGISIPQLIAKNLNRSNLRFHLNLSDGLTSPHLSANFEKFVSDSKKQFTISAFAGIRHNLSFSDAGSSDFYNLNNINAGLSADLKRFDSKNHFIQIRTNHLANKSASFSQFDFFNSQHSVTIGVGKGRIDFANDGTVALNIIEKLEEYGILLKELSDSEITELVKLIQQLKNRRRFVNRSYPLTELEEIQDLLLSFGAIDERVNVEEVIDDIYRYEPMIDRTVGSQFRISATGTYSNRPHFFVDNNLALSGSISYENHRPINLNWQHNLTFGGYILITDDNYFDPTFNEDKIKRLGIKMSNDFHYLVNTNLRLTFRNLIGYDFKDTYYSPLPDDPISSESGFYMMSTIQTQFQFTRTTSATFGINLNLSRFNTVSGLNLGLNF